MKTNILLLMLMLMLAPVARAANFTFDSDSVVIIDQQNPTTTDIGYPALLDGNLETRVLVKFDLLAFNILKPHYIIDDVTMVLTSGGGGPALNIWYLQTPFSTATTWANQPGVSDRHASGGSGLGTAQLSPNARAVVGSIVDGVTQNGWLLDPTSGGSVEITNLRLRVDWTVPRAGDANSDGRFDVDDLLQIFAIGKYETGLTADWFEGDFNGDGVFNSDDLIEALATGTYQPGPSGLGMQEEWEGL